MAFESGTAAACKDCTKVSTESECQNSILIGGKGVIIDSNNKIVRRSPPLEKACHGDLPCKMIMVTEKLPIYSAPGCKLTLREAKLARPQISYCFDRGANGR